MKQKNNGTVGNQLLQSFNIIFENVKNKTALYYFLSNNMTDLIITHKFNFQEEEIMGYYMSFLKTLSNRLSSDTIPFFYNQNNRDFALYIEALKFFNHSDNMIRAAVQTIVLNVYKTEFEPVLKFVYSRTSVPYFNHLVYYMGSNDLCISSLIQHDKSDLVRFRDRLTEMVVQTIDLLHYVNDILMLNIQDINDVLIDQLLHRLIIPLHINSLTKRSTLSQGQVRRLENPRRSILLSAVSMFILAQFFSIIEHVDLIQLVCEALMIGDLTLTCFTGGLSPRSNNTSSNFSFLKSPEKQYSQFYVNDFETANEFEQDLNCAAFAMHAVRSAHTGSRLQAYVEHALNTSNNVSPTKEGFLKPPPRFPAFYKPIESLPDILKRTTRIRHMELPTVLLANTVAARSNSYLNLASNTEEAQQEREFRAVADKIVRNQDISPEESFKENEETNSSISTTNSPENSPRSNSECNWSVRSDEALSPNILANPISDQLANRPFWRAIIRSLEVGSANDYETFSALCLLIKIRQNSCVSNELLTLGQLNCFEFQNDHESRSLICDYLVDIICDASKSESKVRVVTMYLAMYLLSMLIGPPKGNILDNDELPDENRRSIFLRLNDQNVAKLTSALEEASLTARGYFRDDAHFLELFEDELRQLKLRELKVDQMLRQAKLLIPPSVLLTSISNTGLPNLIFYPMRSVDEARTYLHNHILRLPRSETEHKRHAIAVFLAVFTFIESRFQPFSWPPDENGHFLPIKFILDPIKSFHGLLSLSDSKPIVWKPSNTLDLSKKSMIMCNITQGQNLPEKLYIVIDSSQLLLVEPSSKQIGWGVVRYAGNLQDCQMRSDETDYRILHVKTYNPGQLALLFFLDELVAKQRSLNEKSKQPTPTGPKVKSPLELTFNFNNIIDCIKPQHSFKFSFEDYTRRNIGQNQLNKELKLIRNRKIQVIRKLLDIPETLDNEPPTLISNGSFCSNVNLSAQSSLFLNDNPDKKSSLCHNYSENVRLSQNSISQYPNSPQNTPIELDSHLQTTYARSLPVSFSIDSLNLNLDKSALSRDPLGAEIEDEVSIWSISGNPQSEHQLATAKSYMDEVDFEVTVDPKFPVCSEEVLVNTSSLSTKIISSFSKPINVTLNGKNGSNPEMGRSLSPSKSKLSSPFSIGSFGSKGGKFVSGNSFLTDNLGSYFASTSPPKTFFHSNSLDNLDGEMKNIEMENLSKSNIKYD